MGSQNVAFPEFRHIALTTILILKTVVATTSRDDVYSVLQVPFSGQVCARSIHSPTTSIHSPTTFSSRSAVDCVMKCTAGYDNCYGVNFLNNSRACEMFRCYPTSYEYVPDCTFATSAVSFLFLVKCSSNSGSRSYVLVVLLKFDAQPEGSRPVERKWQTLCL